MNLTDARYVLYTKTLTKRFRLIKSMPLSKAKLEFLFLSAQDGDHAAFSRLYEEHHSALLRYAQILTQDRTIAEDATQEAWINFSKNIRKIHDCRAYRSWLYKLTRWRVTDLARRHSRERVELDASTDESSMQMEDDDSLQSEIQKLPTIERQIIQLFYLEEFSVKEVSASLDIPVGTVKSRLSRARQMLKQKMTHEANL